jgi:N6-adenosine-specific RNA methylase IME4
VQVLDAIEKMFPTQKRIELFARKKFQGWEVWGLEVPTKQEDLVLFEKAL